MLVEIMMSALLIALAATAVFKGIDGANALSGNSKARAAATTLAQEDLERMRAMNPLNLSGYASTRQKTVSRVPYTIASTGDWVSDRGGSESCTKGSGRVTFVRVTSSVTWPDMRGAKPVVASTLIAVSNAYGKGSLAVRINDRNAAGVPGIGVNVNSPAVLSGVTNASGCVVWDGLDSGTYLGSFSRAGYVDPSGANLVSPVNGWNVTTGSTGVSTHLYDLAGQANFSFVGRAGPTTTYPGAKAPGMTISHQNMPTAGNVRRATFASPANAFTFTNLFPFLSKYTAYAGVCDVNAPLQNAASVLVPAGGLATPDPVIVDMPVLNVRVRRNNLNYANANVTVTPVDPACGVKVALPLSDAAGVPGTGTDRAFPYGSYTVCADDTVRKYTTQISLTTTASANPATAADLVIPTSGGGGRC
jgi:Tfp pilus assembly protein PilV